VNVILAAALLSLVKCFNGSFVASTRMVFALGRRGLIDPRLGDIHPRHETPANAVLCLGVIAALCMLLGDAILVPVTEVGSVASTVGWSATCAAFLALGVSAKLGGVKISAAQILVGAFGLLIALAMMVMKIVPAIPGHFTKYEWLALGVWIALGAFARSRGVRAAKT
jgi:amino acid transporter